MAASTSSTRRGFVAALSGLVGFAFTATVITPALSLFFDPGTTSNGSGDTRCDCGSLRDLRPGVPRKIDVFAIVRDAWDRSNRKRIGGVWLVRRDDHKIDAFSSMCPHLGCAIDFDPARGTFICPCHQGEFSLADGASLKGPSPRGLDPLEVEVRDEKVLVTFVRYVLGVATRRKA